MTASDYLLLVREDEAAHLAQTPREMAAILDAQSRFAARLRALGTLRAHGRLRPSQEGKRVGIVSASSTEAGKRFTSGQHGLRPQMDRDSRPRVEAGPFNEDGTALCVYFWIRAASLDEALALGHDCPVLPTDAVDVRPVMKGFLDAARWQKRGKIFGYAVLGNAPSEEAWSHVMDRIDAETSSGFPLDAFLGGVRLRVPTDGRRIDTRAGKRATFDGPFPESKEVIGGLFFLRMPALDDAIAWAETSRFVAHGALEVRALWPT